MSIPAIPGNHTVSRCAHAPVIIFSLEILKISYKSRETVAHWMARFCGEQLSDILISSDGEAAGIEFFVQKLKGDFNRIK